jgi:hypothetical protein
MGYEKFPCRVAAWWEGRREAMVWNCNFSQTAGREESRLLTAFSNEDKK